MGAESDSALITLSHKEAAVTQRSIFVSTFIVLAVAGLVLLVLKSLIYVLGALAMIVVVSFLVEYVCRLADEDTDQANLERLECITDKLQKEILGLTDPTDEQLRCVVRRHVRTALFE